MRLSIINDETMSLLYKQIDEFEDRKMSQLVRKSPSEIIKMWLDWQFSRYTVDEQEDAFYVNDLEEKKVIACITKADPLARQHAYSIRRDLNDGKGTSNTHKNLDDLIKSLNKKKEPYTIEDVINDSIKDSEEDEDIVNFR